MATLADVMVTIGAEISGLKKGLEEVESSLQGFRGKMEKVGNQVKNVGQEMAQSFGVAGAAITAGLSLAVKTSMDFNAQMSRVGAIANAAGTELTQLKETALELGASTSKSATEVAKGMENMAAMGFKVNEIIAAMPGVISAAEASGEDMALVADTVATALRSFGLAASEATNVADVLAQSANMSAAGINDMAYTFKYAAPVAHMMGMSLQELAASTSIMANAGIRGEQAGTTLRSVLLSLASPTKDAAEKMNELSVRALDAQGNMLPFSSIIEQLKTATQGMGNAQKAAALETVFGTEAVSGLISIIEAGPDVLRKYTDELEKSSGASAKTADIMKANLKGAFQELQGAVETLGIKIGDILTPYLIVLANKLQELVNKFNKLSPETQKYIVLGATLTAGLASLVGALGLAAMAIGGFMTAITALSGPVGIAVLAIGALIGIGVALALNWEKVSKTMKKIWDNIRIAGSAAMEGLAADVKRAWESVKKYFWLGVRGVMDAIQPLVSILPESMQGSFAKMRNAVSGFALDAASSASTAGGRSAKAMNMISASVDNLGGIFTDVSSSVKSQITQLQSSMSFLKTGQDSVAASAMKNALAQTQQGVAYDVAGDKAKKAGDKQKEAAEKAKKAFEESIQTLDDFGREVVNALRKRYEEEQKIQRSALDKEIDSVRKATDEKIKEYDREYNEKLKLLDAETAARLRSIQDQIDGINDQTDEEEKALRDQEHQKRVAELNKQLAEAENADERKKIQEQLNDEIAQFERRKLLEQRQDLIESLREQMDEIRRQAEEKKDKLKEEYEQKKENEKLLLETTLLRLEEEKKALDEHYKALLEEENLQAEARKLVLDKSQKDLVKLLNDYAPQWKSAGKSFGESLISGLESTRASIESLVDGILSLVGQAKRAAESIGGDTSGFSSIPGLAKGGTVLRGGMTLVGEQGPELLNLPRGSKVTPLVGGSGASGGNSFSITINGSNADEIWSKFERELYRRGVRF